MIRARRRIFFITEDLFLFLSFVFGSLPLTVLLPQHNDQFPPSPIPLYNVPEQSTQFSAVSQNRELQITLDGHARVPNNFNTFDFNNGEEIPPPITVEEHHKPRGRTSYSTSLSEEFQSSGVEDQEDEAIPGEAQQDYPVYEEIPRTGFSCRGRHVPAYYADVEARCQVFHICDVGGHKHSFLCPNGSVFNQKYLVCDWWYDFTCDNAETLFNKQIVPTEVNSVSPIKVPVSPKNIDSDSIFLSNNKRITSQNIHDEYNHQNNINNNNGFVYNQNANRNGFHDIPNTQIDTPQQIYTDNVYVPQNDIFHGAETGFPGRDSIAPNSGNYSSNVNNNFHNQNNNKNIVDNSDRTSNYRPDSSSNNNYNQQHYLHNEVNTDKSVLKTNNENTLQTSTNNDNGNRKQPRAGRKGFDFLSQIKNTGSGNNKEQTNFPNNIEEQANLNRQSDTRNNAIVNNNQNTNFQPPYNNGQIHAVQGNENLQGNSPGNENPELNKQLVHQSIQQQVNFVPPSII